MAPSTGAAFPGSTRPVCLAILDPQRGGKFGISPTECYTSSQRYLPGTNVLQTQFSTTSGTCRVTDFMPLYAQADGTLTELHQIVRHVECLQGQMQLSVTFAPRPDCGRGLQTLSKL